MRKKTGPLKGLILFLLFALKAVSQDEGFQFIPGNIIKRKNTEIGPPKLNAEQLARAIQRHEQFKNVPMSLEKM